MSDQMPEPLTDDELHTAAAHGWIAHDPSSERQDLWGQFAARAATELLAARQRVAELEARPDRTHGQSAAVVLLPNGNIAYDMGIWWREIGPGGEDWGNLPVAMPKGAIPLLPLDGPYVVDPRIDRYREALEELAKGGYCVSGHSHDHCWDCYKHVRDWCPPCVAQYALDPWTGREAKS